MNEKQIFTDAFAPAIFKYVEAYNYASGKSHLKGKLKEAIKSSLHILHSPMLLTDKNNPILTHHLHFAISHNF